MSDRVSEQRSVKPKRGRPPHPIVVHYAPVVRAFFPELTTDRGVANACFRQHAIALLSRAWDAGDRSFAHVFAPDDCGGANPWRPGVLTELGRLAYDMGSDLAVEVARQLDPNLADADAVAALRRARLGREPQSPLTQRGLAEALRVALNEHLAAHGRDDDWRTIAAAALDSLRLAVLHEDGGDE